MCKMVENKVAIITGGAGGIGLKATNIFAENKYKSLTSLASFSLIPQMIFFK